MDNIQYFLTDILKFAITFITSLVSTKFIIFLTTIYYFYFYNYFPNKYSDVNETEGIYIIFYYKILKVFFIGPFWCHEILYM